MLDSFYQRVRPGGRGWLPVSTRLGYGREEIPGGRLAWTNWIAGIIAVYGSLFGIGKLVFGEVLTGAIMVLVSILAFAWIARSFGGGRGEAVRPVEPVPAPAAGD